MTYLNQLTYHLKYLQSGLYPELRGVRLTSILKDIKKQIGRYKPANKSVITTWRQISHNNTETNQSLQHGKQIGHKLN